MSDLNQQALLPCPFCGEEAEIERLGDRRQSTIYACTCCGCRLETGEEWGHGRDWNARAPEQQRAEARNEVLEEAARVADEVIYERERVHWEGKQGPDTADKIAMHRHAEWACQVLSTMVPERILALKSVVPPVVSGGSRDE
jgi:ribosomal protein L37AE/L43A